MPEGHDQPSDWVWKDPRADLFLDGEVNTHDVITDLNPWATGC